MATEIELTLFTIPEVEEEDEINNFSDWLMQFNNVKYDYMFGEKAVCIYGTTEDFERMTSSHEYLISFHELVMKLFNTSTIKYEFMD